MDCHQPQYPQFQPRLSWPFHRLMTGMDHQCSAFLNATPPYDFRPRMTSSTHIPESHSTATARRSPEFYSGVHDVSCHAQSKRPSSSSSTRLSFRDGHVSTIERAVRVERVDREGSDSVQCRRQDEYDTTTTAARSYSPHFDYYQPDPKFDYYQSDPQFDYYQPDSSCPSSRLPDGADLPPSPPHAMRPIPRLYVDHSTTRPHHKSTDGTDTFSHINHVSHEQNNHGHFVNTIGIHCNNNTNNNRIPSTSNLPQTFHTSSSAPSSPKSFHTSSPSSPKNFHTSFSPSSPSPKSFHTSFSPSSSSPSHKTLHTSSSPKTLHTSSSPSSPSHKTFHTSSSSTSSPSPSKTPSCCPSPIKGILKSSSQSSYSSSSHDDVRDRRMATPPSTNSSHAESCGTGVSKKRVQFREKVSSKTIVPCEAYHSSERDQEVFRDNRFVHMVGSRNEAVLCGGSSSSSSMGFVNTDQSQINDTHHQRKSQHSVHRQDSATYRQDASSLYDRQTHSPRHATRKNDITLQQHFDGEFSQYSPNSHPNRFQGFTLPREKPRRSGEKKLRRSESTTSADGRREFLHNAASRDNGGRGGGLSSSPKSWGPHEFTHAYSCQTNRDDHAHHSPNVNAKAWRPQEEKMASTAVSWSDAKARKDSKSSSRSSFRSDTSKGRTLRSNASYPTGPTQTSKDKTQRILEWLDDVNGDPKAVGASISIPRPTLRRPSYIG